MKILFIGYPIHEKECGNQIGVSIAGNKMQLGIIENLYYLNKEIDVISIYPIAPYPKTNKIIKKRENLSLFKGVSAISISFINIPIIKQINQLFSVYRELRKYIKDNPNCKVITFNCFPVIGIPIFILSKTKKIEKICILADLPIDTIKRSGINKFLRKIMDYVTEKSIDCFDKVIALNNYAIQLYAPNKPYIIVDGGINTSKIKEIKNEKISKNSHIKMLFCGALEEYNGIRMLIESMKYVNSNVELHIYGKGPLLNYVIENSKDNKNVFYHGITSNNEMLKIQQEVEILINPRPTNDLISKVTFPSKIIEYMLSGTPVLTTNLNGLTHDYLNYLNIIDDTSAEKMGLSINKYIESDFCELRYKARLAKKFIIDEKNWHKQTKKIYDFIKE